MRKQLQSAKTMLASDIRMGMWDQSMSGLDPWKINGPNEDNP